jgi:hypothetical protein
MMKGVILTKIYCKHFSKCHKVPLVEQSEFSKILKMIKKKKEKKPFLI